MGGVGGRERIIRSSGKQDGGGTTTKESAVVCAGKMPSRQGKTGLGFRDCKALVSDSGFIRVWHAPTSFLI